MIATAHQQPAVDKKALTWTIAVHVLLLLLFFLWRYTIPTVTSELGNGLEVNLGNSENGSGTDQPESTEAPGTYAASVTYKNAELKSPVPKEIVRADAPDATAINAAGNPPKTPVDPKKDNNVTPRPTPRAIYTGAGTGNGGNSAQQNKPGSNEGNTSGPGDRGVIGGTPGAENYTGTPGTGGIGHTLTGRDITPKKFEAEFKESGRVVIHVTVDRDGNIVNKYIKSSSSPELSRIAMDKLNRSRFSKSGGSEPQQFGDVTIIFKAR